MLKQTLINRIYKDIKFRHIPKVAVDEMLKACLEQIVVAAKENESTQLSHFGTFYPTLYQEKKGHNPNTGEVLHIKPHKKLKFKASKKLLTTLK
ncbi:MAG TPA: HU family DNA-binding protein [Oligoflexia bacterium]|nr:HU family DNA-binding protein [Oligoflexia bacterium]HMR24871.1 HU family DNA-binding protein [Oligoflexia bacterium]